MPFSSRFTPCVCWAAVGQRGRILAHVGGLPASAPGAVESITRPVYPPGVFFPVRLHRCRWLAVPRGSADGKKTPARGSGPKPHSSGRGGNCPLKVTLLPSVVNGWQTGSVQSPGLRPAVRRPFVRTAVSPSGLGRHGSVPGRRGRCRAHRGYGASPPVRSTEDLSRRSDG